MERKIKEPGNNPPVATEDQIKSIVQKYLPQFLKELESSAPDLQTISSAQGFAHKEDALKNFSTSKDTNLIERIVRVEEGQKALRDHVDIRFEESKNHTNLRFEETKNQIEESKNHTNLRFEETKNQIEESKKHTDLRFEETKEHIEIRSKGTNRYIAFGTAAILAGMAIVGTVLGVLLNALIQQ